MLLRIRDINFQNLIIQPDVALPHSALHGLKGRLLPRKTPRADELTTGAILEFDSPLPCRGSSRGVNTGASVQCQPLRTSFNEITPKRDLVIDQRQILVLPRCPYNRYTTILADTEFNLRVFNFETNVLISPEKVIS